ncbi:MAG: fused MFS/spermidine synthase [Archangium sp.]|nr:fused MFS/spermidine synthase [Archangium sp.]
MRRFVFTVSVGAVLLFLVQPMAARALLPWFGGSAAVWTTCQLFFQVLLLGGYAWTHGLVARLPPRRQVVAQLTLVSIAALSLLVTAAWWGGPVIPGVALRPPDSTWPIPRLLLTLLLSVGLPYFALATTGPLLQAWASTARVTTGSVYRLYAVSNAGSLLGLLAYPFLLEPVATLRVQGWVWAAGFVAWGVGLVVAGKSVHPERSRGSPPAHPERVPSTPPERSRGALGRNWLALSAGPVVLLLAVTNHLTQEVAPIPFLWVLPLVVYLLSFIVTFESERWYRRAWVLPLLALLSVGIAALRSVEHDLPLPARIVAYVLFLFVACVASHGELASTKPDESQLTRFYAFMATGGALGGVFVGLLAPALFTGFYELELGIVFLLGAVALQQTAKGAIRAAWPLITGVALMLLIGVLEHRRGVLASRRDFFGVVRVVLSGDGDDETHLLMHGRTVHGAQQLHHRDQPTTYYALESGIGRLLTLERATPRRVGVIGLGIGTLAAYGLPGEVYRFYEISPAVIDYAQSEAFTFLSRSKAKTEIAPGDARTTLEREPPQAFDVLVLDAFSSDSVPVHLLTKEAMALYLTHLAPGGVLAFHLSNRSLELVPVAARVGRELGLEAAVIRADAKSNWALPSRWLLLARSRASFAGLALTDEHPPSDVPLWTDDFSSLWRVVRW